MTLHGAEVGSIDLGSGTMTFNSGFTAGPGDPALRDATGNQFGILQPDGTARLGDGSSPDTGVRVSVKGEILAADGSVVGTWDATNKRFNLGNGMYADSNGTITADLGGEWGERLLGTLMEGGDIRTTHGLILKPNGELWSDDGSVKIGEKRPGDPWLRLENDARLSIGGADPNLVKSADGGHTIGLLQPNGDIKLGSTIDGNFVVADDAPVRRPNGEIYRADTKIGQLNDLNGSIAYEPGVVEAEAKRVKIEIDSGRLSAVAGGAGLIGGLALSLAGEYTNNPVIRDIQTVLGIFDPTTWVAAVAFVQDSQAAYNRRIKEAENKVEKGDALLRELGIDSSTLPRVSGYAGSEWPDVSAVVAKLSRQQAASKDPEERRKIAEQIETLEDYWRASSFLSGDSGGL